MNRPTPAYRCFFFAAILLFSTCRKNDTPVASYRADFTAFELAVKPSVISILPYPHMIYVRVPGSVLSADRLVANFTLSTGARAKVNGTEQHSGKSVNNFEGDIIYSVSSADNSVKKEWRIVASNNDSTLGMGLGHFLKKSKTNDRSYDWYIDQKYTGHYSSINCGPSSVTMAIRWADSTFTKTPEDARLSYEPDSTWWSTIDIDNYLRDNNITHSIIPIGSNVDKMRESLVEQVDAGNILILCADMNYIRRATNPDFRTDRTYATKPAFGHFIVVKGYAQADAQFYLQVYDPNCIGLDGTDNLNLGKNRYYHDTDIFTSCSKWWRFAFIIEPRL